MTGTKKIQASNYLDKNLPIRFVPVFIIYVFPADGCIHLLSLLYIFSICRGRESIKQTAEKRRHLHGVLVMVLKRKIDNLVIHDGLDEYPIQLQRRMWRISLSRLSSSTRETNQDEHSNKTRNYVITWRGWADSIRSGVSIGRPEAEGSTEILLEQDSVP